MRRALRWLNTLVEWTIGTMMAALVVVTLAQVYFRYFTSTSLDWSEEMARYLFVWIVFLTGALAVRRRAHIVVDILVLRLPRGAQRGVAVATAALTLVFLGFLTAYGASLVRTVWTQTTPGLGISRGYLFLSVPAGFGLMFLNLAEALGDLRRGGLGAASPFTGPEPPA